MIKRLCLVAAMVLVFSSCSAFAADMLPLVPQDSAFVFSVNLSQILSTQAVKDQFAENMKKAPPKQRQAYDEFVQKTGIDPMKNLDQIMVFTAGQVSNDQQKPDAGVLINGNFNVDQILAAIKKDPKAGKDVTISTFQGYKAIIGNKESEGMGVFLDNGTALIGSKEAIMKVAALKKGKGKSLESHSIFCSLLKKVDKTASIWGAGLIPAEMKAKAMGTQAASLASLDALFFSFKYDDNLMFNFNGEVDKKENVEAVMTSLNGYLVMIKMLSGQNAQAAEVLNLVKIKPIGTTVQITLNVPKAKLEAIRKKLEEKIKSGRMGGQNME